MGRRKAVFLLTAAWYLIMGLGHQFSGPEILNDIALLEPTGLADPAFYATMQGNYYSGTMWMMFSAWMHWSWAKKASGPETRVEIKVATALVAVGLSALAYWYSQYGMPGAWPFVAISATLDILCCIYG